MKTLRPPSVFFPLLLSAVLLPTPGLMAESLWLKGGSERSMYASKIAWQVGDILTVSVNEAIDYNSTQSMDVGSKNSPLVDLGGVLLDSVKWKELEGASVALSDLLSGRYFTTPSSVDGSTNVLSSQIPVAVIDVLPNRNLVVEGMRHLTFSGESRYMVLQGIVRPLDIDVTTNTVASNRVANARIEFIADGAVGQVHRKGWFTRFVDRINPF
jgi:flagellar L-ring protein FlgH